MRRASDVAISDIAGTLMMVGAVVLAGGALTAVVAGNLATPVPPAVSFALAPVTAGDGSLSLVLRNGADLSLDDVSIALSRDGSAPALVPRASWAAPDPSLWRAGDRVSFPLSPVAAASETIEVRILLGSTNSELASLSARTGAPTASLGAATLVASMTPDAIVADATTAARLTVRVSHPNGTANVARVVADLRNVSVASNSTNDTLVLNDAGTNGDEVGGDGNWSGLFRGPALAQPANYTLTINATDLSGRLAGTTTVNVRITGNISFAVGGAGSGGSGGGSGNVSGGLCYGCVVTGGVSSYEGTRLEAPTSANVSHFRLRNWTWDKLTPAKMRDDALVIRIVNSSVGWSMYFRFDHLDNQPCITYARAWTATNETIYGPRNGTCLSINGLDLNLMNPVAEQQLVVTSGNANPNSLYKAAGITGKTTFILAYLRDEDPTGQDELSQEIGVFSMDVVMS